MREIVANICDVSVTADFGVAGQMMHTMEKKKTVIGSPFWMAPEVIQETGHDSKADIWSLGVTCIEMADGRPPFHNIHPMRASFSCSSFFFLLVLALFVSFILTTLFSLQVVFMIPAKPSPTLVDPKKHSAEFNDFIAKCVDKNPENRPTAEALLQVFSLFAINFIRFVHFFSHFPFLYFPFFFFFFFF